MPNTKLQTPEKLQIPSSKTGSGCHWNLAFGPFLELGVWSFAGWSQSFMRTNPPPLGCSLALHFLRSPTRVRANPPLARRHELEQRERAITSEPGARRLERGAQFLAAAKQRMIKPLQLEPLFAA